MKRKLLAILILAAMLVCLLPTAAFALKPGDALPYSKYCSACGQTALHMYLDGYTRARIMPALATTFTLYMRMTIGNIRLIMSSVVLLPNSAITPSNTLSSRPQAVRIPPAITRQPAYADCP